MEIGQLYSCRNAFYLQEVTVWGVTYDTETGLLHSLTVTDPEDGKNGLVTLYLEYSESRAPYKGHYRITNSEYLGLYITDYSVLSAADNEDTTAPEPATNLKASVQGDKHRYEVTATDWAGNTYTTSEHLRVAVENGEAVLAWLGAEQDLPGTMQVQELSWHGADTAGGYSFTLTEAQQRTARLHHARNLSQVPESASAQPAITGRAHENTPTVC